METTGPSSKLIAHGFVASGPVALEITDTGK
jgi:hypothetical protein